MRSSRCRIASGDARVRSDAQRSSNKPRTKDSQCSEACRRRLRSIAQPVMTRRFRQRSRALGHTERRQPRLTTRGLRSNAQLAMLRRFGRRSCAFKRTVQQQQGLPILRSNAPFMMASR